MGLNRSTVTRWCKAHPALLDDDGLVSVDELVAHRDQVINPKMQTRGPVADDPSEAPRRAPDGAKASPPTSQLNSDRARVEAAKAAGAELDLAERLRQTLRRDEVEALIADAGEKLRQAAGQMVRDKAEALARIDDPRAMEAALDDMMRDLFGSIVADLSQSIKHDRPDAA